MYRFIQRHGKKIMAVFAAFLMISMALPAAFNQSGGGPGSEIVGKVGDEKIKAADVYRAHQVWELPTGPALPGMRQHQPQRSIAESFLPPAAAQQIQEHPIMFLLLPREAERMGVTVSNDQLNGMIENIPTLKTGNPDRDDALR